ncbi:unnamed protein product [Orchesella dallaii]|uniref:3'-5' exonuclease domain-containing protein n=1 Tax=Orchesella dallaii TaxID=48710 RepID=A0ABP1R2D8_9HEXA
MSLKLNKYVPPDHCQAQFDFERGTPVRVCTREDGVFEGEVTTTPFSTGPKPKFLELVNVIKITPTANQKKPQKMLATMKFQHSQLDSVVATGSPNIVRFDKNTELVHQTLVIDDTKKFEKLENTILDKKPSEVGLYFCGLDVGRRGDLYYIAMYIVDTIIIIDCDAMKENIKDYMLRLDTILFSNENIVKVVYDSRHIADWLYHYESIYLRNIFDIQVTELYLWSRGQPASKLKQTVRNLKYRPLSEILKEFMDPSFLPDEEVKVLKEYEAEAKEFTELNHPMRKNEDNVDNKKGRKWVAIQVKHLVTLRNAMLKRMMKLLEEFVTINVSEHVAYGTINPVYDITDELAIPPGVIKKLISSLPSKEDESSNGQSE